jgi:ethanolamine transporter EutH
MGRIIFELSGFFFLPFICYAGFLIWQERHPSAARAILTRKALQIQTLIGLVLVVAFLLVFGLSDEHKTGGYVPAVVKDGKLVPGRIE